MESLHGRVRVQWAIRATLAAAVLAAIVLGVTFLLSVELGLEIAAGLFLAVVLFGVWHAVVLYTRWRYELQSDALYLERGVVTEVETAVPYVRVQHVDTQRTPIDRLLGISRVVVYTAGSRGADVTVPGLTDADARGLRNDLRELAVESEPDDAV